MELSSLDMAIFNQGNVKFGLKIPDLVEGCYICKRLQANKIILLISVGSYISRELMVLQNVDAVH